MSNDSIQLRALIKNKEDEINIYRNKLNILEASKYNLNRINYDTLILEYKNGIKRQIRYISLFMIYFSLLNLFLYYKNIITSDKFILLLLIKIIIKILMIQYYDFSVAKYNNQLKKNKEDNQKILIQIENEKNKYETIILKLKEEITIQYNQLKFLTNIK